MVALRPHGETITSWYLEPFIGIQVTGRYGRSPRKASNSALISSLF
jgi:hypothetical protein